MSINPTAFDALAADYDTNFTASPLGRLLRRRVWTVLARHLTFGQHLLELACGTGEDACWLASRGRQVTATDGSPAMVDQLRAKVALAGLTDRVTIRTLALQGLIQGQLQPATPFDGAFSNFGGLNTINEWSPLAEALARLVKPGGRLVLVPMGPLCPWELAWHLAHGQPGPAFRRFRRNGATATIGDSTIPIWYPRPGRLRTDFSPWFAHRATESLGLWLPPSYLGHLVDRWPGLFRTLDRLERATARLTGGWGDHYIIVFERREG